MFKVDPERLPTQKFIELAQEARFIKDFEKRSMLLSLQEALGVAFQK